MAKLPNSAVVLRFRVGRGLVKARQRYENTSRAILDRVLLQYKEGFYEQFRDTVAQQLEQDVRSELENMAGLYRKHIIGFSGRRTTPSGMLTTMAKGPNRPTLPIAAGLPPWAPRTAQYLRAKRTAVGHIRWFDNTGWNASTLDFRYARRVTKVGSGPDDPGLLKSMMTRDSWETLFGLVNVSFRRARNTPATDAQARLSSKGSRLKVQLGSIYVRAAGKIDPSMLPGYTSGFIRASSAGNPRLMEVIAQTDPRLAFRLGTMRNGVYRPTLEPFLGFFLTRALPFAVARRLEKGNLGSLIIK